MREKNRGCASSRRDTLTFMQIDLPPGNWSIRASAPNATKLARPLDLARYIAMSASRSGSSVASGRSARRLTLMPMLHCTDTRCPASVNVAGMVTKAYLKLLMSMHSTA